jgi:penicillin-binding protein 1B
MRVWNWIRSHHKTVIALKLVFALVPVSLGIVSVESLFRAHLDGASSHGPIRFYARPLVIEPGMALERATVEEHLTRLGYRRSRSRRDVAAGDYYLGYSSWTIGRRAFRHHQWVDAGGTTTIRVGFGDRVTGLRDADDRSVRSVILEPEPIGGIYGSTREDRIPITLADVPSHLMDAVLTIEDQRFFQHGGLDFRRILGATLANLRARRIVQGASTLTQQLAKNLFLSAHRSPVRKLREAAMAVALEARYDKETILQAYLNEIYLGQEGALAIHGVGSAARHYFAKDVSQLTLAESALLAGIIRGPSIYSPFRHPESAVARRDLVLDLMYESGAISEEDKNNAQRARLDLRQAPERTRDARYFVDFLAQQLEADYGREVLGNGMAVFTTLDMRLQRAAEGAVRRGLEGPITRD